MPDDKNMKAVPKLPRGGNVNGEPILRGDNDMEMVAQRKPKMRPRGGNSPVIGDNGLMLDDGDNARFMQLAMRVKMLPKIDVEDPAQVEDRINEYFSMTIEADLKPTVAGLANSLGVDRKSLWDWKVGRTRLATHTDTIKKAYGFLEELWENYMLNGKINPVSGIFIAKNNYGYTDVQEHILTPNTPLGQELTKEQIRQAVEELPEYGDD